MEEKWSYKELEDIQPLMGKRNYSHADLLLATDLYNRIFNKTKSISSCGKCGVNTFKALERIYNEERTKRG